MSVFATSSAALHWPMPTSGGTGDSLKLGQRLIANALALHSQDSLVLGLKEPLYAMDSTVIDLCLSLFPWADFRSTKAAVKAHTVVDLRGAIPVFLCITTAKVADSAILDQLNCPVVRLWCWTVVTLTSSVCLAWFNAAAALWCAPRRT